MGNDGAFLQDEDIKGGRLVSDSHPATLRTKAFFMPQDICSCTGYRKGSYSNMQLSPVLVR